MYSIIVGGRHYGILRQSSNSYTFSNSKFMCQKPLHISIFLPTETLTVLHTITFKFSIRLWRYAMGTKEAKGPTLQRETLRSSF